MTELNETPAAAPVNARDISYALSAKTPLARMIVRFVENISGRYPALYRLSGYSEDIAGGEYLWDCMWRRFSFAVKHLGEPIETIPESGPAVLIANHPYGIADAVILGWLMSQRRDNFKIVANAIFAKAPELAPYILPVDFDVGREAQQRNLQMRRDALQFLKEGGMIGIFPSGAISSAQNPFGYPYDPEWKTFTSKLVGKGDIPVIPLLFPSRNTVLFEAAGRLGPVFRYGLNFHEFNRRTRNPIEIALGTPLDPGELRQRAQNPVGLMSWLRAQTYALGANMAYGERYGAEGPPNGMRWP